MKQKYIGTGLTDKEVIKNRATYGANTITTRKQEGFLGLLLSSFGDPMIRILLIALGIKTIFLIQNFDWYETVGIVIAIFVASFISTISEYGSEKAFAKLQEESAKIKCRVKRNNKVVEIPIDDVVVGDIVCLEAGDRIPADGILIEGEVTVDESSLNGEAKEAYKEPPNGYTLTRKNELFRGTVVYSKQGLMLVKEVGDKTFYGRLASEIQEKQPESPLKLRLKKLANMISWIGYIGAILVSFSYLFSIYVLQNNFEWIKIIEDISNVPMLIGHILYALTLSVTIIVVAVPEGLPMMITLVLSSNMKRMLKNNVLVRKLVGIETAGSLNILFSDKTGTITKGKLEVIELISGNLKSYHSEAELMQVPKFCDKVKLSIVYNNASTYDETKKTVIGGNITDRCLLEFLRSRPNFPVKKLETIPFNSKDKYAITTVETDHKMKLIKGAPEKLLPHCTHFFTEFGTTSLFLEKARLTKRIEEITKRGIRVIALAINDKNSTQVFQGLTFVGLVLIKDEIREEAKLGLSLVEDAQIQTVMITGDNKDTAIAIGTEVGLLKHHGDLVLTSDELSKKTDEEVKALLPKLRIVARSLPQDKSRLVRLSQELDLVVGMTGDGVNDAPALKKADVGFAMGSGTEVSKEAADIVILDDNFLSISKAILFGRTIFKSIRKFIILQLTINLCAISLSIIGPFIGVDTPITVIQMLWINMVMDTFAGLAFAYEPPLVEYMKEKPKKKNESIMNKYMIHQICFTGFYSAILCVLFLKLPMIKDWFHGNESEFMTAFFGLFIFIDIFNSFNARTHRLNLLAHIKENKVFIGIMTFIVIVQVVLIYHGGALFRTTGLTFREFEIMLLLAFTVVPVDWCRKLFLRKKGIIGGV